MRNTQLSRLKFTLMDPAGNVSEPTVIDVVIDTGATPLGLIEGITWNDADADGIQDAGEAGLVTASSADAQNALLPGVVVNLLRLVGQASSRCSTATANR